MKTRSLGIAFAALLALAPVRGSAQDAATTAAPANGATPAANPSDPPKSVARPAILSKTAEPAATPSTTEAKPRKERRYARQRYAYWEPFPMYWPSYQRQHMS